jgi:hypothetical protein
MKNLSTLIKIYQMTEMELKKYVAQQLKTMRPQVTVGDGYVFAKGTVPVLLVAHLDTVHKETPKTFVHCGNGNIISSPEGIGGDDRNGVYSVLETARRYNCSVLFCEQEEIGGIGAEKFTTTELAKTLEFNYIIEFDRKGSNDAVFYECDNPEFEEFIIRDFYNIAYGSFSDISILAPFFGCAAVNLSCGYYKAHTKDEYVVISEMEASINAVCKILARTTSEDKFEYIEAKYGYGSYYGYSSYYDGLGEGYYMLEYIDENNKTQWYDTMALSELEAIGRFCTEHPDLPSKNVIDILYEAM